MEGGARAKAKKGRLHTGKEEKAGDTEWFRVSWERDYGVTVSCGDERKDR